MQRRFRSWIALTAVLTLAACALFAPRESSYPPILFVHGASGHAGLWAATLWRFESNGWPRDRLFAVDLPHPRGGDEYDKEQTARTTAAEHVRYVVVEVERVRKTTGAERIVVVTNSRGGFALRDYIRNGAGKVTVSHAILGGTPNHGIWSSKDFAPRSEFNAIGPYLAALNSPQGPDGLEVTPGVAFMTVRSNGLDKFTQPNGYWFGQPQLVTNIAHDSPELKGAENVILPGADHLEVSYGPEAFAHAYRFITGKAPESTAIVPESTLTLDGKVTGQSPDSTPTNLPLAGARVEVFQVAPETGERLGAALHARIVADDGRWGPFSATPGAFYEFVVSVEGYATTHTFRLPFPRSSNVVHLRPVTLGEADRKAGSVVAMVRLAGYVALDRDRMSLDGKALPGIAPGVPGLTTSVLRLPETQARSVVAELNGARLVVRTSPVTDNHYVRAEFHY